MVNFLIIRNNKDNKLKLKINNNKINKDIKHKSIYVQLQNIMIMFLNMIIPDNYSILMIINQQLIKENQVIRYFSLMMKI
jgi:hypothetical protein